jgi:tetratricopeptide (TPR) repeat protein
MYLRERMSFLPPAPTNTMNARSAYARIIDNDPTFAGGYAGKSITHSIAVIYGHGTQPEEDTRTALELAERAIALDEHFALSHTALAFAHIASKRLDKAVAAARRAVELLPGGTDSRMYLSTCLTWAGHGEEAREEALTALRLDPQYVAGPYYIALGRACYVAERYLQAIEAYECNVSRGGPISVPMLTFWAASHVELGQMDKAREIVEQLLELEPGFTATEVIRHYWSATPEQQSRREYPE